MCMRSALAKRFACAQLKIPLELLKIQLKFPRKIPLQPVAVAPPTKPKAESKTADKIHIYMYILGAKRTDFWLSLRKQVFWLAAAACLRRSAFCHFDKIVWQFSRRIPIAMRIRTRTRTRYHSSYSVFSTRAPTCRSSDIQLLFQPGRAETFQRN